MATTSSEPFPLLGSAAEQLQREHNASNGHPRRRRRSSALGGEIRAGDTGPGIATSASTSSALKAAQHAADDPAAAALRVPAQPAHPQRHDRREADGLEEEQRESTHQLHRAKSLPPTTQIDFRL